MSEMIMVIDKIELALDNLCNCGGTPTVESINLLNETDTIVSAFSCFECYPHRVWTSGMDRRKFVSKYVHYAVDPARMECNDTTAKQTIWQRLLQKLREWINSR